MYAKKKQNPTCMHSWSTATWGKDALKRIVTAKFLVKLMQILGIQRVIVL